MKGAEPAEIDIALGVPRGTAARWMTRPDFDRLCADLSGATDIEIRQQHLRLQKKAVIELRRMMDSADPSKVKFAVSTVLDMHVERRKAYRGETLPRRRRRYKK